MNKLIVPGLLAISGISATSSCKQKVDQEVVNRPNILFIMADDHTTQAISAYSRIYGDIAPTPNIDRIAREGMLFKNVFCTNAICGPSRACILTGKYSHKNGFYKNEGGGNFNPDQWTFPEELHKQGYKTALFGKWHLGSVPVGFDYYKFHEGNGQQGYYWNPVFNENGQTITEKGYATNLTTDFALEWLEKTTGSKQPFCLLLQYKAPHRNWEPDTKYEDLWKETVMPYPKTFIDTYKGREKTAGDTYMTMDFFNRKDMKLVPPENLKGKELNNWLIYGNNPGENWMPEPGMTLEESRKWKYQKFIKDYLACVKSVDDNVGRVLEYLDKKGLSGNTLVVYTSDQGFYLGDHGWFDKRFMYEESLRMPFLVRYPAKIKAGSVNSDIITNIDFAPTLLEAAGIKTREEVQGRSFFANLTGETPSDWEQTMYYHYYEFPFWHHVRPHCGIRTPRYKLIHFYYKMDVWELYDLEKDPEELNNAIDDPAYASVISELKIGLGDLIKRAGNDKPVEEWCRITDTDFGKPDSIIAR